MTNTAGCGAAATTGPAGPARCPAPAATGPLVVHRGDRRPGMTSCHEGARSPVPITRGRSRQSPSRRRRSPAQPLLPLRIPRRSLLSHRLGASRPRGTRQSPGSRRVVREAGCREGRHDPQRPHRGPAPWGFPQRTSGLGEYRTDPGTSPQAQGSDWPQINATAPQSGAEYPSGAAAAMVTGLCPASCAVPRSAPGPPRPGSRPVAPPRRHRPAGSSGPPRRSARPAPPG